MRSSATRKKAFSRILCVGRALWSSEATPLTFLPTQLRKFYCTYWATNSLRLHRTTNNGLAHFSLFLCCTSIFILLPLSLFSLPTLFFSQNLFQTSKFSKNIPNFKKITLQKMFRIPKFCCYFEKYSELEKSFPFFHKSIVFQNCSRFLKRK